MKKNIKFGIKWVSTVGRITKICSSTWGDGEPHPQHGAPCHYEMSEGVSSEGVAERLYRMWICHCKTPLCRFVDYNEVKAFKYRIQD